MSFLSSIDIVGSALTASRYRSDVILQNITNADTTLTSDGGPYQRKQVIYQEKTLSFDATLSQVQGGVQVAAVVENDRDFRQVYDPTHPQADEDGYVLYPNVDTTEEMIDLMAVSNAYEANLTALSLVKAMINKTLDMSK